MPQTVSYDLPIYYSPFPFSRLNLFLGLPASEGLSFTHIQPIIKRWTIDANFESYNSDGWLINHFQKRHRITLGTHIPLDSHRYIYFKGNIFKDQFGTNNGITTYIPNLPSRIQPVNDNFSYSMLYNRRIFVTLNKWKDYDELLRLFRDGPRKDTSVTYFMIVPHLYYEEYKFTHFSDDTLYLLRNSFTLKVSLLYDRTTFKVTKHEESFDYKQHYLFINLEPTFSVFKYPRFDSSWFYGTGLNFYIDPDFFKRAHFTIFSKLNYFLNSSLNYLTYYLKLNIRSRNMLGRYSYIKLAFITSRQFSPWFWHNPLMKEHSVSLYFNHFRGNLEVNLDNLLQFFPLYEVYDTSQTLIYTGKLMTVRHDIKFIVKFNKKFNPESFLKISMGGSVYSFQSPAILPVYKAFVQFQLRPGKKRNFHVTLTAYAMDNIPALFYAPLHYWGYVPVNPGINATADIEIGWRLGKALVKGRINNISAFINPELYRPVQNWLWAPLIHFSLLWDMFY